MRRRRHGGVPMKQGPHLGCEEERTNEFRRVVRVLWGGGISTLYIPLKGSMSTGTRVPTRPVRPFAR